MATTRSILLQGSKLLEDAPPDHILGEHFDPRHVLQYAFICLTDLTSMLNGCSGGRQPLICDVTSRVTHRVLHIRTPRFRSLKLSDPSTLASGSPSV